MLTRLTYHISDGSCFCGRLHAPLAVTQRQASSSCSSPGSTGPFPGQASSVHGFRTSGPVFGMGSPMAMAVSMLANHQVGRQWEAGWETRRTWRRPRCGGLPLTLRKFRGPSWANWNSASLLLFMFAADKVAAHLMSGPHPPQEMALLSPLDGTLGAGAEAGCLCLAPPC